ncbi:MAG TPA: FAD-linked oxidase C-terminal domain-containing protein [Gemmataceae bacterium]|nr:FAD-linked oxidase C-terminal domain-containing protein [Gemmataceae bacterium]
MTSLTVIREQNEKPRFERQHGDDSRTAIATPGAEALAAALRGRIGGEVRFDAGSRALYATDASNYRQVPIGVVLPRDAEDVVATVATAREFGAPTLSRGGGTSLAGQSCNVAVLMDFSKYIHHVLRIDAQNRLGVVEPGCVLDDLRHAANQYGLTFGPDPATHSRCTLGGMLGNNSCGAHSLICAKHGIGLRTSDNTLELEILTYDGARFRVGETSPEELEHIIQSGGRRGEIYARLKELRDRYADTIRRRYPKLPRRVSGYNLDELLPENNFNVARALVGSESTLVTILEATLRLVPNPKARSLLVLGYPDVFSAGDHVTDILPLKPTALEGLDHLLIEYIQKKGDRTANLKLLPEGKAFLMVEFGGDSKQDSDDQARQCMDRLKKLANPPPMKLYDNKEEEEKLWRVREGGLGATAFVPGLPDMWPGWEDSAVPPENVGPYLRGFRKILQKYGYNPSLYGHFGQGCIHCRIDFDLYTADGVRKWRSFLDEAADLVVQHGGALSGEHGDGQARAELLPKMFGEELVQAFREFKSIWDPEWKMNPGKIVDPYPITSNLRLGPDYNPPNPETHFHYPNDHGAFSRAALRCVGVGQCRNHGGQTMCPSYMVTREEKHSTRGRARLLWEMLNGEVLTEGWRSEAVRDALDLCLSCKGCKSDCPVNVDIATYKAEFLSHYYEGRLRPRHAYSMGLIYWWARLASQMPALANFFTQTPVLRDIAKWLGGIAPQRQLPRFARQTFKDWFRARVPAAHAPNMPVAILWPDTFTNHFHPEIAKAGVEVLEAAGYEVWVPEKSLCCGRPLYDFGMLETAKRMLRQILDTMRPQIRAGIPVVGLEPSCVAVFRDEMPNFFPYDEDAKRLQDQTFLLSEFLNQHAQDFEIPPLHQKAMVHGHCHHKSVMGLDDERAVLKKLGLDFEIPEDGCCGMAGSFGFERGDHYEVSIACGERALLPAVRDAGAETLVVANGFSCQEQIAQTTNRRALHLAEVIRMALQQNGAGHSETDGLVRKKNSRREILPMAALGAAAVLVGVALESALTGRR